VTLRGAAHDDAGHRLDENGFVWTLDGVPLAHDEHLVLATELRPGDHTLVLAWEGAGASRGEARVQFSVEALRRSDERPEPPDFEPPPRVLGDPPLRATIRLKP
jgi:hypothetical protein